MLNSFSSGLPEPDLRRYAPLPNFLEYAWTGDIGRLQPIINDPRGREVYLNTIDPITGMNALHIAVGRNNLEIVKLLVEAGIAFVPDKEGRMPSLIAAICEASEELADYIAEAEEKALSGQG